MFSYTTALYLLFDSTLSDLDFVNIFIFNFTQLIIAAISIMTRKPQASGFIPSAQGRFSRHQNKKTKKLSAEREHKQLIDYLDRQEKQPLITLYEKIGLSMPGHLKLGIWRKNMSLLTRCHLPVYIKILDYVDMNESVLVPSKAYINPKKNNKSDILIEDPVTQKTRLIKMETFPILLCPSKLAFYKLSYAEFQKIFFSLQSSKQDLRKVFNYLLEEFQSIFLNSEYILWPIVILEGLNYKFQQISQIVTNFKVSNIQNTTLVQNLLKIVNEGSLSQIMSESNIRVEGSQLEQKAEAERPEIQAVPEYEEPQIVGQQNKDLNQLQGIDKQKQFRTQNKMCIWLIGTACFDFVDSNIVSWQSLNAENVKRLFSSTLHSNLIKQTNLLIQSLNKHKKMEESQLKADQYKYFIYRIGMHKTEEGTQSICIPLRFQYMKGVGKKILIKILRTQGTELKWVPTQTTTVNYTLSNLSKKQLNFFYLSNKIPPLQILSQFIFRQFFYLPQRQTKEVFRSFYPYFHVTQQEAYYHKCQTCRFMIRQMPFKSCFFCQVYCHQECAILKGRKSSDPFLQQLFEVGEAPWICQKCQPCSTCMQAVGAPSLFCSSCFSYFHQQCGKIKRIEVDFGAKDQKQAKQENEQKFDYLTNPDKYVCQSCLKCKMCSYRLKDNDYLVMDNQFYCSQCSDKIKTNNHCHICMKKKEGNSTMKWIQCGDQKCQKWVHQICDPQYISIVKSPTADDPYLCPLCRIFEKRKIYVEVIDSLAYFDQAQFFIDSGYKDIPFYCTIISEPMCFNEMKQKVSQGLYDVNAYKNICSDFNLIINNALKFNMPKDTAHIQAKILKILGQKALEKYKPLFSPDLRSLIAGKTIEQFKILKLDLIRQINSHYPQILLNYRSQKSFIEIKELKKKTVQTRIQEQKFNSSIILTNLLKNSTILFHLKKQKVGISNLFTMPKSQNQRGIWHSIKGDLCYYHPNPDVVFSCNQCCESFCCIKQCIRHRTCACGQKGCKCDSYQCGCPPLKQKQKKLLQVKLFQKYSEPLKTYRQILMDLTENFRYCLKCAQDKIPTRICAQCGNLCSWGYFRCPDCSKVWHKKCYPHNLPVNCVYNSSIAQSIRNSLPSQPQGMIPTNQNSLSSLALQRNQQAQKLTPTLTCGLNYCRDCLSEKHENTFQQILTLQSKSKLVKISKITRYMRIFIQVFFNEGIRLTPYQIQQLILDNYDQFSIRQQLFKQYELNYVIMQRFRDISFKTNAVIQRSCDQYMNDYVRLRKGKIFDELEARQEGGRLMDAEEYVMKSANLWRKYFGNWSHAGLLPWEKQSLIYQSGLEHRLYWETISQLRQQIISQAYTYTDFNTFHNELLKKKSFITNILEDNYQKIHPENEQFSSIKQYKSYISSLSYIDTLRENYYKHHHQYRYNLIYHPRSMPFDYRPNSTFKKKSNLQSATKQFLMGIYEQNKYCLRKGSTCILQEHNGYKHVKNYWSVLKKWGRGKRELSVVLQKKGERWYVRVDGGYQKIVNQVQDIIKQITKKHNEVKINSFKQLGQFLGFTIFQPFYKANHFTTFLQTNLVDEMPLLQRMNKISELYSSFTWGDNAIFWKSGPASLVNSLNIQPTVSQKTIIYEYSMSKVKPPYLSKKQKKNPVKAGSNKKVEKRLSNMQGQATSSTSSEPVRQHPFITFEDIRKFFILDPSTLPIAQKLQISLKNNTILNQVFIAPSKIHKLGLFSRKFMKKHSIVIQYVGEIVSQSIADLRQKKFHYGCYLFGIMKQSNKDGQDKKDIIDATFRGNMARYLNHSCDPNCKAKTEYINGCPRIIIYTIRDIQQFEEITYDYQFNVDAVQKLECTCGAKNCQGRLN